jgi:16S rRNA (guanine1207-N2)-methyltransferase
MYEQASISLVEGGSFWIVIQQKHGAPSAIKKLESIFEKVEIVYKKKGFYIVKSTKN